jgi:hypothetical protein
MPGLFEQNGSQSPKPQKYAPLFISSLWEGYWSNRSILQSPGSLYETKYLGGRPGAMSGGLNCEITVRNTVARRFGTSSFSGATYPTPVNTVFSFELLNNTIQTIVDTGSTGSLTLTAIGSSSGGSAVVTGTFPAGGSNAYAGLTFQVSGFTTAGNNFTAVATASTTTTITLTVSTAVAETHSGTIISSGAVYYDNQAGGKTLLFSKLPGASQTTFQGVAGILYAGDSVSTWVYTPGNSNGSVWNWGIVAPANQPSVLITPSGSASVQWTANTMFTTMGLIVDAANNAIYQLNSVNESGTNTTEFGLTGNGQPAWNQTVGGTTSDNSITWTNISQIVLWTASTVYGNASVPSGAAPSAIYDPATRTVQINIDPSNASGKSGGAPPKFSSTIGGITHDNQVKWQCIGLPGTWVKSHAYPKLGSVSNNNNVSCVVEPTSLANGLPSNQTIYLQASGGGTSASSATSPFNASTNLVGTQVADGDLIWLSLGPDQWAATTAYSAWSANATPFSAVKDSNNNFQVCITTGISATVQPGTSFTLSAAGNASGGNTVYTGTFSPTLPVSSASVTINAVISGFTTAANNGTFKVISCTATQLTVANASGVSESHAATAIYNPWGAGYGNQTVDGTSVWTCVGTASGQTWTASQKYFLLTYGFQPPSSSAPFGGSSVIDSNANVEFCVNSGLAGGSAPSWNATTGGYTDDAGSSFTLSQVTVNANGTSTYTGTSLSGLQGQQLLVSGFTNQGNNILITPISASATTLIVNTTSQVNETHTGAAKNGLIWLNLEPFSSNSLSWTKGYNYAYAYKARATNDFYSVNVSGTSNPPIPPGLSNPLPSPFGSLTGDISSTSPAFTITGPNAGAVNTVSGVGSTDLQVDAIVIYRSADGGSSGQMFELTEIPAPKPIGGIAQPFSFKDFLPDTPTSVFPGLNPLEPAPIDGVNDPPPNTAQPVAYNFERIWCMNGQQIIFSGGPDTLVGNPNAAFNAADEFPYLSQVIRAEKSAQGLIVFTSNSIEVILGGPLTASFYSVTAAPGIGLGGYNGLCVYAGELFFMDTTGSMRILSPNLSLTSFGFAIADQLAQFNPKTAYVTFHDGGTTDQAIYVGTGSTAFGGKNGYFRCNPRQIPGGINGPEPVWSPFAAPASGGFQMLQSVEVSPGVKKLLIGSTAANASIGKRDTTVYTDSGAAFDANFQVGALMLAHRGELAALKFIEFDFASVTTASTVTTSYLLNEISGTYTNFQQGMASQQGAALFDPPQLYGMVLSPTSYNPLRYPFAATGQLALCAFISFGIDFGTTSNADEVFNTTVYGKIIKS